MNNFNNTIHFIKIDNPILNLIQYYNTNYKKVIQLNISNKNISGVLDLKKYIKLKKLDCSNNQITQIINIPKTLKNLDCSNNLIEEFNKFNCELDYFNSGKII